jgi:tRNA dimethylallyltransferase
MPVHAEPIVLCLMGPTGTGKTELALRLAERLAVEIISVDSAMVYRHMNIGTAKPDAAARSRVPHHLIDLIEPSQAYSAGQFRVDAVRAIREIRERGRTPLLAGGTLLYFRALWRGLADLPPADAGLRVRLDERAARDGWPALHAELARIDPEAAARIKPTDPQRIQRALEVFELTGQPISVIQRRTVVPDSMRFVRVALVPRDRSALYGRLDKRFSGMLKEGLLHEVEALMKLPAMSIDCPAMRAVGYRQLWRHLSGELDFAEAVRQAQVATHHLAKRQLTWLRSEESDLVLDPLGAGMSEQVSAIIETGGVAAGR